MRDDGTVHEELSLRAVTTADVFHHEDVAALRELSVTGVDGVGGGLIDAVGRALHEDGQRLIGVSRAKDDGMKTDAVTHGDHRFMAIVGTEMVVLGLVADARGRGFLFAGDALHGGDLTGAVSLENITRVAARR